MARSSVILPSCLSILFACVLVHTVVRARTLRPRHEGDVHRPRADYYDFEGIVAVPRHFRKDTAEDSYSGREQHQQQQPQLRARYLRNLGRLSEPPSSLFFQARDHHASTYERSYSSFQRNRRKRHGAGKHGNVNYRRLTEQDRRDLLLSKQRDHELQVLRSNDNGGLREAFELEVKEAQNSSICNYTVVSIPDTTGSRVPKDLEHVMCNHAGSSCQSTGAYCCIQTYRMTEVSYGDGVKEIIKIYVGCVCALQIFNDGLELVESSLPIND